MACGVVVVLVLRISDALREDVRHVEVEIVADVEVIFLVGLLAGAAHLSVEFGLQI